MENVNPRKKTRVVGIDFGMARVGIAISDELKVIATPIAIVKADKKTERTAQKVLDELAKHRELLNCEWEEMIVGIPFLMSGKKGFLADEVQFFIEQLQQKVSIPIIAWDERLTTVQAERSMREGGMTRKKRSQIVDTVSAVIILQNYLDFKRLRPH